MSQKIRTLLVATVAVAALSAHASSASALNIDPAGAADIDSLGKVTFDSIIDIECNVDLGAVLREEANNTPGTVLGTIDRAASDECTGAGEVLVLADAETPWNIRLAAEWAGPTTSLALYFDDAAFSINEISFVGDCLYRGDPAGSLNTDGGGDTLLLISAQTEVPLFEGGDGCPDSIKLFGTFAVPPQALDM